ncbi:MAG: DsbA family protein, partial [Parvularculaceae bacterium]|nr:DsbA family protein [Parvularculaceae bacterium]
ADAAAPEEATTADAGADEAAAAEPEGAPIPEGSLAGGEMSLGSPDAPLTITEFASVTCPGCAGFHATHFPDIKEQLIDTGQVRFIYKEFPTPPVRLSQAGFILARCSATETGSEAYFAMVDALYKTQRSWIASDNPGESLRNIAAQAGIGEDEFESCFERQDIRDAIVASIEEGRDLGLTGTPSFVVDGEKLPLSGTTEEVIDQIKAEIAKRQ